MSIVAEDNPSEILAQGPDIWNAWRKQHVGPITFAAPHWYSSPDLKGRQVKGRNRLNFSGVDFRDISIFRAFAEGLNLRSSAFEGTVFEEGDFSRADFSGSTFCNTRFNKTILTGASFDGATFVNCNLSRVNLAEASFRVKEITETVVYGIAAWDLRISEDTVQSRLVIEKTYEFYSDLIAQGKVPLMVDDIELAQFVYYLSNHRKMRDTLNILNDRGVLLLGQFRDGGLQRLYAMRDWFRKNGYMPMIFDFARPDNLSLTETVVTMAGLSKFVVVDLSGPAMLTQIKKPVLAFGHPYALFADLTDQTRVITFEGDPEPGLEAKVPELERLHAERIVQLAARYGTADRNRMSP